MAPSSHLCHSRSIHSLDKKWEFEAPDFRWYPDAQAEKPQGQLRRTKHFTEGGTKFSFFKSYYLDDTVFVLLSRGELFTAPSLPSLTFGVLG
jgi:hypothetical protein